MSFEKPPVIIDNGSYSIKAGFACDNHPVAIFRTAVGRPNYLNGSYGKEPYDVYIGDDAIKRSSRLEVSYPVRRGNIVHWDNMERIFHHIMYRELKVAPEDRSILLACAVKTPMKEKLKCCEVIFETLNVPALCIQSQAVLSLYGCGYTTGITVDLGYQTVDIVPVYEGGMMSFAVMSNNLPATNLNKYIEDRLAQRNIKVPPEALDDIRNFVYVTKNSSAKRFDYWRKYKLPSGEEIEVGDEAWFAVSRPHGHLYTSKSTSASQEETTAEKKRRKKLNGEVMFQPGLVAPERTDLLSLQEAIFIACLKCDPELVEIMLNCVVPCGGMSMIPGLMNRLQIELERKMDRPVNVFMSDEAYTTAWLGGAAFAGMSGTNKLWVTKAQYDDFGDKIVKNKFL